VANVAPHGVQNCPSTMSLKVSLLPLPYSVVFVSGGGTVCHRYTFILSLSPPPYKLGVLKKTDKPSKLRKPTKN